MFTPEQISRIERLFAEGLSIGLVAQEMGMPRATFDLKLARSGKFVGHCLRDITPVSSATATAATVAVSEVGATVGTAAPTS